MTKYVIETGGKQYIVSSGEKIKIEKLDISEGEEAIFDKILMIIDGDDIKVGKPYLDGEKISATLESHGRDKKKIVFRYHSKTRYHKKKGHRQNFSKVAVK